MKREDKDILINLKGDDTIEFEMSNDENTEATLVQTIVVYFLEALINNDSDTVEYANRLLERKEFEYVSEVAH